MLKELFESIWTKGQKAQTDAATPKEYHKSRANRFLLMPDGQTQVISHDAPARHHTACTLADFCAQVTHYHNISNSDYSSIWIDPKDCKVIAILNDGREGMRDDCIVFNLQLSDRWKTIQSLDQRAYDQKAFLYLLRVQLAGSVPDSLRPKIAKLEFVTTQAGKTEINPGRERGTREFAADLANSGEIPEEITAASEVFIDPLLNARYSVQLALEYSLPPGPVEFKLTPFPDELSKVMQAAIFNVQARIEETLKGLPVPVTIGRP